MGNNSGNCYSDGSQDNINQLESKALTLTPPKPKMSVIPEEVENANEGKTETRTLRNGREITGVVKKNKIPFGEIKYPNGDFYEGIIFEGMANGEGKMLYADGCFYEGTIVKDLKEGRGVLKMVNGNVYKGLFVDDLFEGKGVVEYANGDVFEGREGWWGLGFISRSLLEGGQTWVWGVQV